MASRADISAGRAYVELLLKDGQFTKGLKSVGKQMRTFGLGISAIGAAISAAGAGITGPLLVAVKKFASSGDVIDKMSRRTGIGAAALSELGFAAEQSGKDIEVLEHTLKKMQKTIGAAFIGGKEAYVALHKIGVTIGELRGLSPDQQFEVIAEAISKIKDPTVRAARAMAIFGRSGTDLLPMMENGAEGIRKFRKEARDLGLSKSPEDVKLAGKLTEAFGALGRVVGSIWSKVGRAIAPTALEATRAITGVLVATGKFVKEHQHLVRVAAVVGAGLVIVGTAVTGLGLSFLGIGIAMSGLAKGIGFVGSVLGVLLSPISLITGALAAGAFAWARYTASGQATVKGITTVLGKLATTFKTTFKGIGDAIMVGDLELAGRVAMAGLKVSFLQGVAALSDAVGGEFGNFIATIGAQIAGGDLTAVWDTTLTGLSDLWAIFSKGLVDVFTGAIDDVMEIWRKSSTQISDWLLKHAKEEGSSGSKGEFVDTRGLEGGPGGAVVGLPPESAGALGGGAVGAATGAGIGAFFGGVGAVPGAGIGFVAGAIAGHLKGRSLLGEGTDVAAEEERRNRLNARIREQKAARGEEPGPQDTTSFTDEASKNAAAALQAKADAAKQATQAVRDQAAANATAALEALKNKTKGSHASETLAKAEEELARITGEVGKARAAKEKADQEAKDKQDQQSNAAPDSGNLGREIIGTYSASALSAGGAGFQSTQKEILALHKQHIKALQAIREEQREQTREIRRGGPRAT